MSGNQKSSAAPMINGTTDYQSICDNCGEIFGNHYGELKKVYSCPVKDSNGHRTYAYPNDHNHIGFWLAPGDCPAKGIGITLDSKPKTSSMAINDHTCPTCKNNRCSKTEKSCWKCGNKL